MHEEAVGKWCAVSTRHRRRPPNCSAASTLARAAGAPRSAPRSPRAVVRPWRAGWPCRCHRGVLLRSRRGSPDGQQRVPGAAAIEAIGHELDRQRESVVADAVGQDEAHARLGQRAPRLDDAARSVSAGGNRRSWCSASAGSHRRPHRRRSTETARVPCGPGINWPSGIEHDFRVADASENLQEVFLEEEAVVGADRARDQQVAAIVARDRLQRRHADVLRLAKADGIGVLVDLRQRRRRSCAGCSRCHRSAPRAT